MQREYEWMLPLGRRLRISFAEIRRILFSATFLIFTEIVVLLFIVFDVHRLSEDIGTPGIIVYWHLATVCTVFFCLVFLILSDRLSKFFRFPPPYTLFVASIALWPALAVNRFILALVTGTPFVDFATFLSEGLITMVAVILVSFILFEYCAEYILKRPVNEPETKLETAGLVLGEQFFPFRNIVFIKSAGHYLEIQLNDGSVQTVYGKLSALDCSSNEGRGFSPHRSYWVPRHEVEKLSSEGKKTHLNLASGGTIPVAAARKRYVRDWLLDHQPSALK